MTKKKSILHMGHGTKDIEEMARKEVGSFSSSKSIFLSALQQAAENARDAFCRTFSVTIDKRTNALRFADDGEGFGTAQVNGFLSFCVSPKKGMKNQIGQRGSGRYSNFQFSDTIEVYTRHKEYMRRVGKRVGKLVLTYEDFKYLLGHDYIEKPLEEVDAPDWFDVKGTGSVIVLKGVNWDLIPAPSQVIDGFGKYLSPTIANMVRINGKRLKPRDIHGNPIRETWEHPLLGSCRLDAYLPKAPKPGEGFEIAAYNPVMPFEMMVRQLHAQRPELAGRIPRDLTHTKLLCGVLYAEGINQFVASDRRSLVNEFFVSEHVEAWVEMLSQQVVPLVIEELKQREEERSVKKRQKLLEEISDGFNQAFHYDPTKDTIPEGDQKEGNGVPEAQEDDDEDEINFEIAVNSRRVDLLPGDSYRFEVLRTTGTSGSFEWVILEGGGSLSTRTGRRMTFTAGLDLGKTRLLVRDTEDEEKSAEILVNVVPDKNLRVTPGYTEITAGEVHTFHTKNRDHHADPNRLQWSVAPETDAIALSNNLGASATVEVHEGCERKKFILLVQSLDDETVHGEATFLVKDRPMRGNRIKIQDTVYALDFVLEEDHMRKVGDLVQLERDAVLATQRGRQRTIHRLWINQFNPAYESAISLKGAREGLGLFLMFVADMAHVHLVRRFEDDDFDTDGFDEPTYRHEFNVVREEVLNALLAGQQEDEV